MQASMTDTMAIRTIISFKRLMISYLNCIMIAKLGRAALQYKNEMIIFNMMLRYIVLNEAIRPDGSAQSLRHDIVR